MSKSFKIGKKRSSTGKYRVVHYCPEFRQKIREYYEECNRPNPDVIVFRSKRRRGSISVTGVNNYIVKPWIERLGIDTPNPSSHTLRKTMARQFYLKHGLVMTMKMLGHTSESVTLRYVGIAEDDMNVAQGGFSFAEPRLIDKIKSGDIHYNGFLYVTRVYNAQEFEVSVKDYLRSLGGSESEVHQAYLFLNQKRGVQPRMIAI